MLKYILLIIVTFAPLLSQYDVARIRSPYLNEFKELEVGPNDLLWAGTWGNGVYRSDDEAESWQIKNSGLTDLYISDLNYNDGILLAATYGGGVFKSDDEGNNWEEINTGLYNLKVTGVAVKSSSTFFCSTEGNGVFRTTDGGATWEEKNEGLNFQDLRFIHLTPAGNLLIGLQGNGIYRSDDNGENWKTSQSGIFNKYVISIQNLPNDEIWVSSAGEGIFQSSSDGNHWLRIDLLDNLIELNIESFTYFKHESTYYQVVGTRNWGIWRFDPQWNDPRFLPTIIVDRSAHSMVTLSTGRIVAAIGSAGIAYSDNDGDNFTYIKALREGRDNDYKVAVNGKNVMVGLGTKGIYHSNNYGYAWEDREEVASDYGIFEFENNRFYFSLLDSIKYSTNYGANWIHLEVDDSYPIPTDFEKYINFNGIYHSGNTIILTYTVDYTYVGMAMMPPDPPSVNYSVLMSTDNGNSWFLNDDIDLDEINLLGITKTSNGNIYVLAADGSLFRSTNNGTNWTQTSATFNAENTSLSFIKSNGNRIYVAGNEYVEESIDNGDNFTRIDYGFDQMESVGFSPKERANDMAFTGPNEFYTGFFENYGVYKTKDNGANFDSLNNSYPTESVRSMASNSDGDVYIATSSIWRYVDEGGLPIPKLLTPPDKTQNMSITANETGGRPAAEISWEDTDKADIYEIQVSEFEQFYNFMYKKVHAGTSATLTDSLKYNTTYYWRVRSKINDSYGKWSSRWEFTTELPAPTLTYPDENEVGVPIQPVYTWENVEGAENYIVQVASNLDFQDIVFSETVTSSTFESGTFTSAEVLSPSTQYFWRMKSLSSKSESRWSEYNAFTTVTAPPTLIYPENNAKEIPTELTYKFKGVENASRYRIQTSSDSTFEDNALRILDRNTETDSTHFFDFLQYYREYYWRVQSILIVDDGQGNDVEYFGEWSETWKFTTGIKPPGLVSPPNNSFDVALTTKLEWDEFDGAVGYHIQLGLVEDFTDEEGLLLNDTIDGLSFDMPEDILDNYNLYYWRMRVILEDDLAAAWVSPWRFTTIMKQSEQVNPSCESEDMPLEFTFVWEEVKGGDLYRVEVSKTQVFNEANIVFSEEEIDADRIKIESGLEPNNTYYWRVQGYNANNTGPWSEICSFTTETSSVRDIAKEFNFIAYPNPTSDKMNYEFTLQEASNVTIEIYDLTGVKLSTLCDKYLSNGVKNFSWDVSNISNGTYNLVMTVNGKSYMKLVGVSK